MAYSNQLFAVAESRLPDCRGWAALRAESSDDNRCSHLVACIPAEQPLFRLLAIALDGGETLPDWRHRLRPPRFHRASVVLELSGMLEAAWQEATETTDILGDDWVCGEIARVRDLYQRASDANLAVVSILDQSAYGESVDA